MKSDAAANPFAALERLFHEPGRLAVMSALLAAENGLTFTELRDGCRMTDGNLNRHLKVLEDAGAITAVKQFVHAKPRTTVFLSREGLNQFQAYLAALESVLQRARRALPARVRRDSRPPVAALRAARA